MTFLDGPLAALEGMACEVVPIATRVGGIPELIEDGKTWIGFRPEAFLPKEVEPDGDNVDFPFRITRIEYDFRRIDPVFLARILRI